MLNRKDYRLYWIKNNKDYKHICDGCDLNAKGIFCKASNQVKEFKCVSCEDGVLRYAIFKLIKK